ncbi:hypothetical protein Tco_1106869 [Tanacetum coccineum]
MCLLCESILRRIPAFNFFCASFESITAIEITWKWVKEGEGNPFGGVIDWYQSQGYREPVVMSSVSSAVTYTSVYTDSEPGRVFWGADEEISDRGIPRVIVLGYDGLPMQLVAPPSPDYIPGPEDPQTPPVLQDEDKREPMFIQAHDPDYVPEPIYPEYIPLENEHELPAEEPPLPPVDSPTAESPGYVTESDPEEDPEEYEDDETKDGPVDYPMDGGDDGDDDDGDSSRDDADDEEEGGHLAPADSTVIVPTDEPVFLPEGTEPVIPPPSTNITIGARITIRPQASISLPPVEEVERLLAMTTPSPSPPISLSPPSAGERLARIASTQALIDAVTAVLPSPSLPPLLPSLYIPPPIDRKDAIPESEQPPRKRLCLSTLGSRYEIGESSTARPTRDRGVDYGFVSTIDAEARRQEISKVGYGIKDTWVDLAEAVPEIAPMIVGEVNTRVTKLAELHEHDTQDLYALLEDAQDRDSQGMRRARQPAPDARIPNHQDASGDADSHIEERRIKMERKKKKEDERRKKASKEGKGKKKWRIRNDTVEAKESRRRERRDSQKNEKRGDSKKRRVV